MAWKKIQQKEGWIAHSQRYPIYRSIVGTMSLRIAATRGREHNWHAKCWPPKKARVTVEVWE